MEALDKLFRLLEIPEKNWEKVIERAQALQTQVVTGENHINQQQSLLLSYLDADNVSDRVSNWLENIFSVLTESEFYHSYASLELDIAGLQLIGSKFYQGQLELDVLINDVANWLLDQLAPIQTDGSQFKQLIPIVKTMLLNLIHIPEDMDFEDEEKRQQLVKEKIESLLPSIFDLIKIVSGKDLLDGSEKNNETLSEIFKLLDSGSFLTKREVSNDGSTTAPTSETGVVDTASTPIPTPIMDEAGSINSSTEYTLKVADLLQHLNDKYPNLFILLEQPPVSHLLTILKQQDAHIILLDIDGSDFINQATALFELPVGADLTAKTALMDLLQERIQKAIELMIHVKSIEKIVAAAKQQVTAIVDILSVLFADLSLESPIALIENIQKKLIEIFKQLLPINQLVDLFESVTQWLIDIARLINDSPIKLSIAVTDAPLIDVFVADNERLSEASHAVVVKEKKETRSVSTEPHSASTSYTTPAQAQESTTSSDSSGKSFSGVLSQLIRDFLLINLGERIEDKTNKDTFNQLINNTYFDERLDSLTQKIDDVLEKWKKFVHNTFSATGRSTLTRIVMLLQQWINGVFRELLKWIIDNLSALIKLFFALIQVCVNAFVYAKLPGFVISGQLYRSLCLGNQISVFCLLAAIPITLMSEIFSLLSKS